MLNQIANTAAIFEMDSEECKIELKFYSLTKHIIFNYYFYYGLAPKVIQASRLLYRINQIPFQG